MKREEFIKYLKENDIPYGENGVTDAVYVYSKKEHEEMMALPEDLRGGYYVGYLRVSHFDEDMLYTRDNGVCGYRNDKWIMRKVKELGRV